MKIRPDRHRNPEGYAIHREWTDLVKQKTTKALLKTLSEICQLKMQTVFGMPGTRRIDWKKPDSFSLSEEERRDLRKKITDLHDITKIALYDLIARTSHHNIASMGPVLAYCINTALGGPCKEDPVVPAREWLLFHTVQASMPQNVMRLTDVALQESTIAWQDDGKLVANAPSHFRRNTLQQARDVIALKRTELMEEIRRYAGDGGEAETDPRNLQAVQALLAKLAADSVSDRNSREYAMTEREFSEFDYLETLEPSTQRQVRHLVHTALSQCTFDTQQRQTSVQPPLRLHQQASDHIVHAFREIENRPYRQLEAIQQHDTFGVTSDVLRNAYLRKYQPDAQHKIEALLVQLSNRGISQEVLCVLAELAPEFVIQWNEKAAQHGESENVIASWSWPETYTAPTLQKAVLAAQDLDPGFIEEASAILPLPLLKQLQSIASGSAKNLEQPPKIPFDTPTDSEGNQRRSKRSRIIDFSKSNAHGKSGANGEGQNGDRTADHKPDPVRQREHELKNAELERKKMMRSVILQYLVDSWGTHLTIKEAEHVLVHAGLTLTTGARRHKKQFKDSKGGKAVISSKQLRQNSLPAGYVVGYLYGHHGTQYGLEKEDGKEGGIGDLEALYNWVITQKDYRPRKSNGS